MTRPHRHPLALPAPRLPAPPDRLRLLRRMGSRRHLRPAHRPLTRQSPPGRRPHQRAQRLPDRQPEHQNLRHRPPGQPGHRPRQENHWEQWASRWPRRRSPPWSRGPLVECRYSRVAVFAHRATTPIPGPVAVTRRTALTAAGRCLREDAGSGRRNRPLAVNPRGRPRSGGGAFALCHCAVRPPPGRRSRAAEVSPGATRFTAPVRDVLHNPEEAGRLRSPTIRPSVV